MSVRPVHKNDPRLTREQSRAVDRLAIEQLHIPGIVLMENAGLNAADVASGMLEAVEGNTVAIICGGGNNGGDGYVIARHLHNAGRAVSIYSSVPTDTLKGDTTTNHAIARAMGLPIRAMTEPDKLAAAATQWTTSDLLIDALLGTGYQAERGLRDDAAAVIDAINRLRDHDNPPMVLAIDVPSGLDCDTGQANPAAVVADATVTFVAPKVGFDEPEAAKFLGQLFVAGIGTPPELAEQIHLGA